MEKTWKPIAAGVICIIAGIIDVIMGVMAALWWSMATGMVGVPLGMGWMAGFGLPLIVLGAIAIIGGVFALKRRVWWLALVGSICAFPIGILSLVFVIMGKNEFE